LRYRGYATASQIITLSYLVKVFPTQANKF